MLCFSEKPAETLKRLLASLSPTDRKWQRCGLSPSLSSRQGDTGIPSFLCPARPFWGKATCSLGSVRTFQPVLMVAREKEHGPVVSSSRRPGFSSNASQSSVRQWHLEELGVNACLRVELHRWPGNPLKQWTRLRGPPRDGVTCLGKAEAFHGDWWMP